MESILLKNIIRSKIENADEIYNDSCKLINKFFQDKIWELSEKATSNIVNFIETIEDKIYNEGGLITSIHPSEVIYKDDEFTLSYSYSLGALSVAIIVTDREDIEEAYKFINVIRPSDNTNLLESPEFTIYYRGKFIIRTQLYPPTFTDQPAFKIKTLTSLEGSY